MNDKPLVSWSIDAGLGSKYIDSVVVSTDDKEIADVSLKYGADVPFIRPARLSSDEASSIDVVMHAISALHKRGFNYKYVVILQPTSPLRTSIHIDEAIELFLDKGADGVIGVSEVDHPVEWINTLPYDLSMDGFIPDKDLGKRSQDFSKKYRINGAIYILSIDRVLRENKLVFPTNCYAYIMSQNKSIDIDTEYDFMIADLILKLDNRCI